MLVLLTACSATPPATPTVSPIPSRLPTGIPATVPGVSPSPAPLATATRAGGSATPAGPAPTGLPPAPTATPETPPPGFGRVYQNDALGYRLPYPDGWTVAETGNRAGFGPSAEAAQAPDFTRGPGVFVTVLKSKSLAQLLALPEVTPVELLQRVVRVELPPGASVPVIRPLVRAGQRAADAFVYWPDTGGAPVAAYVLVVQAGTRGVALVAGAPAPDWPAAWPLIRAMAAGLATGVAAVPPGPDVIGTLVPGGSIPARLALVAHTFEFEGQFGDYVTLAALAGPSTDPAIALYDSQGRLLASDDDRGTGLGAVLSDVPLEQAGTYHVVVWDMGGGGGDYSVQLLTAETPSGGGPLRPGEAVIGTLAFTGVQHGWTLALDPASAGPAGSLALTVTRVSGDVLPTVRLLAPDGQVLAAADSSPANPVARLAQVPLERAAGRYRIEVQAAQGTGDYRLEVSTATASQRAIATPGTPVRGSLAPGQVAALTLQGGGQPLQVDWATAAGQSVEADVYDPAGRRVAWSRNDLPRPWVIPGGAASYRVLLSSRGAADYTFVFTPYLAPTHGGALARGTASGDTLQPGETQQWTFAGGGGEVVDLALDADPALGAYLALDGPGAVRRALAFPSGGKLVFPELPLLVTGTYTVEVGGYHGSGRYTLTLKTVDGPSGGGPLGYGAVAFGTVEHGGVQHAWTFPAAAGENATITLRRGMGDLAYDVALLAPSGRLVAAGQSDADGLLTLESGPLPEDGSYAILVTASGATTGDYEIDLVGPAEPAPALFFIGQIAQ